VCGGGYMIHAHPSCGVSRERYNTFPWQNRIRGFYRVHGKYQSLYRRVTQAQTRYP
jgi:hypothetical protein